MALTMADAVYVLLKEFGKPLQLSVIVNHLLSRGWINSSGLTPGASISASIGRENTAQRSSGEIPRFEVHDGVYGLVEWRPKGIEYQIQEINRKTRENLRELIAKMPPKAFEDLVGKLLIELGFDEATVEVKGRSGDGGIDVVGVMNIEGVTRMDVAVQVKRVKAKIAPEKIRALRGSLLPNQRGIFITTSGFTALAAQEASESGKSPISLVDGDKLLDLLFQHGIGVTARQQVIYDLADGYWSEPVDELVTEAVAISSLQQESMLLTAHYPITIFARRKDHEIVEATLFASGQVIMNGQTFKSVSSAGSAVSGWKSCNGWTFWSFINPVDGQSYLIDMLRSHS